MRTRSSFFASLKLSRFFDGRLAKPRAGATDAPTRGGRAGSSRRDGGAQSGDSGAAQAARLRAQLRRQQAVLPLIIVGEGRRSATRAAVVYRAHRVSIGSSSVWVYCVRIQLRPIQSQKVLAASAELLQHNRRGPGAAAAQGGADAFFASAAHWVAAASPTLGASPPPRAGGAPEGLYTGRKVDGC